MPTRLTRTRGVVTRLAGIAFVFDDTDLTGLGDEEIPAGDPQIRVAEFVAKKSPRLSGQGGGSSL